MRNDVHFPPPPGGDSTPTPAPTTNTAAGAPPAGPSRDAAVGGHGGHVAHPHPDRAHSLERTRDRQADNVIYDMPEDRGGIDSTTLSIVVVAGVAVAILIIAYLFFSRL